MGGAGARLHIYINIHCALPYISTIHKKSVTNVFSVWFYRICIYGEVLRDIIDYLVQYERLYGLHIFPIGTAQVSVQLKMKPFKMSIKPPTYQVFADISNETLCCGAYGDPDLMSGKWVNAFTGEEMYTLIEREGDLFKIKTNITRKGSYRCRITFLKSVVQSTAVVKIFERKLILLKNYNVHHILHPAQ